MEIDEFIYQKLIEKINHIRTDLKSYKPEEKIICSHLEEINMKLEEINEETSSILSDLFDEIVCNNVKYIDVTAVNLSLNNQNYLLFLFSLTCFSDYVRIIANMDIWETTNIADLHLDVQSIFYISIMLSEFIRNDHKWNYPSIIKYVMEHNAHFNQYNHFLYCQKIKYAPRRIALNFYQMLIRNFLLKDISYIQQINHLITNNTPDKLSTFLTQINDWEAFVNQLNNCMQNSLVIDDTIRFVGLLYSNSSILQFLNDQLYEIFTLCANSAEEIYSESLVFFLQRVFNNNDVINALYENKKDDFLCSLLSIMSIFNEDDLINSYDTFLKSLTSEHIVDYLASQADTGIYNLFIEAGTELPEIYYSARIFLMQEEEK